MYDLRRLLTVGILLGIRIIYHVMKFSCLRQSLFIVFCGSSCFACVSKDEGNRVVQILIVNLMNALLLFGMCLLAFC